jgi:hypothetical protein
MQGAISIGCLTLVLIITNYNMSQTVKIMNSRVIELLV